MASYSVIWKSAVEQELRAIDRQYVPRIIEAAESLASNPYPANYRKLQGVESSYRIRVGDYRIIYEVDSANKSVIISHVRHRKDAYRK